MQELKWNHLKARKPRLPPSVAGTSDFAIVGGKGAAGASGFTCDSAIVGGKGASIGATGATGSTGATEATGSVGATLGFV